jgi:hypothetical protein
MRESTGVKEAVLRYYACAAAGDVEGSERLVTSSDPAVVIGTGPGEMTVGRDEWVTAFGQLVEMLPGLVIEPGALQDMGRGDGRMGD